MEIINYPKIASTLCILAGVLCIGVSLVYNEFFLAFLDPNPPLYFPTIQRIRGAQFNMFLLGMFLVFLAEVITPRWLHSQLKHIFSRPIVVNMLLSGLFVLIPLILIEWILTPFVIGKRPSKSTTIFIRDNELGWRLKPNTSDKWGNVVVSINKKGLRGPEIPYKKEEPSIRILYLGDSVTFGYKLEKYEQSFPYVVENILKKEQHHTIETINAGVGGYSPWQYYKYLEKEGIKYEPDIVVVSFVLNDVYEKLELSLFGGDYLGNQLSKSYYSLADMLKHKSSIYYLVHSLMTKVRFGKRPQERAIAEEVLFAKNLAYSPDNPHIEKAWKITLENLTKIVSFCKTQNIPLLLVVFPFMFQFEDIEGSSAPQRVLREYSEEQMIPCLDLLPLLHDYLMEKKLKPDDLFLDHDHLSPLGSEVVASMIVDFIHHIPEISILLSED